MGIVFGLAAAIKHNVLLVPVLLVLHWLVLQARWWKGKGERFQPPAIPLAFLSMMFVSPIVFVLHWPYLWPDIVSQIQWYLNFHLNHEHYPILYFGQLLTTPFPLSFPFVMSAITIPVVTLCMMVLGLLSGSVYFLRNVKSARQPTDNDNGRYLSQPISIIALLIFNGLMPFFSYCGTQHPYLWWNQTLDERCPFLNYSCCLGVFSSLCKREITLRNQKTMVLYRCDAHPVPDADLESTSLRPFKL